MAAAVPCPRAVSCRPPPQQGVLLKPRDRLVEAVSDADDRAGTFHTFDDSQVVRASCGRCSAFSSKPKHLPA